MQAAASMASSAVSVRNRDGVAVDGPPGVDRDIAAGLNDPVKGGAVDDQVLFDRKGPRAERFNDERIAALETAHMQLTEGRLPFRTMGDAVDHRTAHAADPLPAVMVKGDRLLAFLGQFFIEDIDHFQKGHVRADVSESIVFKSPSESLFFWRQIFKFRSMVLMLCCQLSEIIINKLLQLYL